MKGFHVRGKGCLSCAFAVIFSIMVCSGVSHAYRPFITEDAGVAGKGVFQLEGSWDYLDLRDGQHEHALLFVPIAGVSDRIEVSLEIPYLFHNFSDSDGSVSGIGDVNAVVKGLVIEEQAMIPAFALRGSIKTNTGDASEGLGSGDIDLSFAAAASKALGDFILHAMFGYTVVGDNGDSNIRDIYYYGFAVDYGLTEQFHLCTEFTGNRNSDRTAEDDPMLAFVGGYYEFSERVIVDTGVRFGLNDDAPAWNTTLGVTFTF